MEGKVINSVTGRKISGATAGLIGSGEVAAGSSTFNAPLVSRRAYLYCVLKSAGQVENLKDGLSPPYLVKVPG